MGMHPMPSWPQCDTHLPIVFKKKLSNSFLVMKNQNYVFFCTWYFFLLSIARQVLPHMLIDIVLLCTPHCVVQSSRMQILDKDVLRGSHIENTYRKRCRTIGAFKWVDGQDILKDQSQITDRACWKASVGTSRAMVSLLQAEFFAFVAICFFGGICVLFFSSSSSSGQYRRYNVAPVNSKQWSKTDEPLTSPFWYRFSSFLPLEPEETYNSTAGAALPFLWGDKPDSPERYGSNLHTWLNLKH